VTRVVLIDREAGDRIGRSANQVPRPFAARLEETMMRVRTARSTMALFTLLGILSAGAVPAFAEGLTKVKGTVVDKDGKPMAKVPIWLEAVDIKKTVGPLKTDKDGKYNIATLDRTVAKKWRVVPKLEGYKVVKVTIDIMDSSGNQFPKNEVIMGSKQEFPEIPFVLVGDDGHNIVDLVLARDADFVAAVQFEQRKKQAAQTGAAGTPAGAAAAAAPAAGAGAPGSPAAGEAAVPKIAPELAQMLQKAKSLADAGNHVPAIELYRSFLAKDPTGNPNAYYYLGKSLFATDDDAAAAQAFSKGLELDKDMKRAHFYLGNIAIRADNPTAAAAEFEKELALSPDFDPALYNLGQAYYKTGDLDRAVTALDRAAVINPQKPETLMLLAAIYEQKGDKAKAEEMYQKVAAIDPHNAAILFFNVGVKAWNEKRPKEAIQAYNKAIEIDPTYAQAHRELGTALMASQDFAGALKHFQEYLTLNPKAPDAKEVQEFIALLKK
jgi:tetratricopeptide (TPR) repeat protein